jgi:hypothetical protein
MSFELRDLEDNLIDAELNPLISTHEGFNGSPNEIVFKVVNTAMENKDCLISLIGILPQRSEYRIANSSTQLSGQEWSEIESNASSTISISADSETIIRVRIFIPGGTSTQIIDANINVEEVSN